ncbi:MAG: AAA family ATPase [Deltaproteobacteria bacterium]|nr:AAA family ATPase [Deltaproteobacteria bacterium]
MRPRFAIGNSSFPSLRGEGCHFVDKSLLIADVVHNADQVVLLPRPRRFGKTLALTMLRAWFAPGQDHMALFGDLAVWQAGDDVRATCGSHPVIFLSFKDVKARTWSACRAAIAEELSLLCGQLDEATAHARLAPAELGRYERLRSGEASDAEMHKALQLLSIWLSRAHGRQVLILIDEYDTPIVEGKKGWLRKL